MFENWQDKLGSIFGVVGSAGSTITNIAGGAIGNVVNPLLGSTKTTTTTAPPPEASNNNTKILVVVAVVVVIIIVAVFAMNKKNKSE